MTKDWQLKGRGALITGSEGVIGRAIAEALAAEGVNVCSVNGEEGAEAIVEQATEAPGHGGLPVNAASEGRRPARTLPPGLLYRVQFRRLHRGQFRFHQGPLFSGRRRRLFGLAAQFLHQHPLLLQLSQKVLRGLLHRGHG